MGNGPAQVGAESVTFCSAADSRGTVASIACTAAEANDAGIYRSNGISDDPSSCWFFDLIAESYAGAFGVWTVAVVAGKAVETCFATQSSAFDTFQIGHIRLRRYRGDDTADSTADPGIPVLNAVGTSC